MYILNMSRSTYSKKLVEKIQASRLFPGVLKAHLNGQLDLLSEEQKAGLSKLLDAQGQAMEELDKKAFQSASEAFKGFAYRLKHKAKQGGLMVMEQIESNNSDRELSAIEEEIKKLNL
jgi:hypothetical protein